MKSYIASLAFLFTLGAAGSASAGEQLNFGIEDSPVLSGKISSWLASNGFPGSTIPETARINLNRDQIPEIVLRIRKSDGSCSNLHGCKHFILADTKEGLESIGEFAAFTVQADAGHEHEGVKNLIVCKNPWNDFACGTYVWNSPSGKYEEETDSSPHGNSAYEP